MNATRIVVDNTMPNAVTTTPESLSSESAAEFSPETSGAPVSGGPGLFTREGAGRAPARRNSTPREESRSPASIRGSPAPTPAPGQHRPPEPPAGAPHRYPPA